MLPTSSSYSTYGGEKTDYQLPEDSTTDRSADQMDEALVDVAAMTRMSARAFVTFTTDGATCALVQHDAVWGSDVSVAPSVTRTMSGHYLVTWPATVTDARGNTRAINLRRGIGNIELGGWGVSIIPQSPNSVSVVTGSMGDGGVDEAATFLITAFVW